ncbi:formylmethanofuran dehydrogenase [Methylocystis sp. MJC1]|uniref:formylmethanofuran dehydrogenase n=1 Tax=Methylocystis sp. MJC1 TaxID=2654282 RepID=UPI0013EE125A|nr:formylmethanofuran dehydrogenase [Methylocystis sp. MJC1]KAF2990896.1 Formyltransferase/hydrolase complex Fhc subunit B [Methylocystis sp. MJC1]MBU6527789.1 formylmethanofuran dehydrogenase [Methylocystis sp. MJC1]UZX10719.1 formylmethanofuran dehydrogenase [Methylocystis sp. MJC1]
MSKATLDGKAIALEDAYKEAARILSRANFPLVAGLGADVPGARAAILLAERLRGAFDHLASGDLLADIDVKRSFGMFTTTANEARVRADVVVLVGPGLTKQWPGMLERLAFDQAPCHGSHAGTPRKVIWLGPDASEANAIAGATVIPATLQEIPGALGVWRARVGGRPVNAEKIDAAKLELVDGLAETLKNAKFGCFVWAASAGLDALTIEMMQALVTDLNVTTRFTGVHIGARAGASGVTQAAGWMTGFPPRTGFGRGYPEHDPWRFEASRLVDSGEADAALWISAFDGEAPSWSRSDIPLVTLAPAGAAPARGLYIEVGQPGVTHDAVLMAQETGGLTLRTATASSDAPTVAHVIDAIMANVSEVAPC